MHNLREAISHYCKLIPCIVSEKNWSTKEDKDNAHDVCIVHTVVSKKACLGMKQSQTVKKSSSIALSIAMVN